MVAIGPHAHPLYRYLTRAAPGLLSSETIKWNFIKFLVDRSGQLIKRHALTTRPADLKAWIEGMLAQLPPS